MQIYVTVPETVTGRQYDSLLQTENRLQETMGCKFKKNYTSQKRLNILLQKKILMIIHDSTCNIVFAE